MGAVAGGIGGAAAVDGAEYTVGGVATDGDGKVAAAGVRRLAVTACAAGMLGGDVGGNGRTGGG